MATRPDRRQKLVEDPKDDPRFQDMNRFLDNVQDQDISGSDSRAFRAALKTMLRELLGIKDKEHQTIHLERVYVWFERKRETFGVSEREDDIDTKDGRRRKIGIHGSLKLYDIKDVDTSKDSKRRMERQKTLDTRAKTDEGLDRERGIINLESQETHAVSYVNERRIGVIGGSHFAPETPRDTKSTVRVPQAGTDLDRPSLLEQAAAASRRLQGYRQRDLAPSKEETFKYRKEEAERMKQIEAQVAQEISDSMKSGENPESKDEKDDGSVEEQPIDVEGEGEQKPEESEEQIEEKKEQEKNEKDDKLEMEEATANVIVHTERKGGMESALQREIDNISEELQALRVKWKDRASGDEGADRILRQNYEERRAMLTRIQFENADARTVSMTPLPDKIPEALPTETPRTNVGYKVQLLSPQMPNRDYRREIDPVVLSDDEEDEGSVVMNEGEDVSKYDAEVQAVNKESEVERSGDETDEIDEGVEEKSDDVEEEEKVVLSAAEMLRQGLMSPHPDTLPTLQHIGEGSDSGDQDRTGPSLVRQTQQKQCDEIKQRFDNKNMDMDLTKIEKAMLIPQDSLYKDMVKHLPQPWSGLEDPPTKKKEKTGGKKGKGRKGAKKASSRPSTAQSSRPPSARGPIGDVMS